MITDARIGKIEERLSLILQKKLVSTRELASVTGSVISLSPVFGNLSRIMSRHCQISIAASPGWDFVSELDSYCVAELQFWFLSINHGYPFCLLIMDIHDWHFSFRILWFVGPILGSAHH